MGEAAGVARRAASEETQAFWARQCKAVDPWIRPASSAACGQEVALAVAYTGDTGQMAPPSRVSGEPVSADTNGAASVVTVAMRYGSDRKASAAPLPPARARTRVLMVRRDGAWYVATPQSFNPLLARGGGPSGAALRSAHRKLVAAARG